MVYNVGLYQPSFVLDQVYILLIFSSFLSTVRFHLAHIAELQGNIAQAKLAYEQLLQSVNLSNQIKANAYRQLGKPYTVHFERTKKL